MFKKLLAIAMIGTAMSASAAIDMQFRDGLITNPDFGGHFLTYFDEETGVTTFKSISATTTLEDITNYCHEYLNDAQLSNLDIAAWANLGGGMQPSGFWKDAIDNPTAGPRYVRTKKPVGGSWADKGMTAEYQYIKFSYKTNKANNAGNIFWQEGLGNPVSAVAIALTVDEEWQEVVFPATPAAGWTEMNNNGYMWMQFNDWTNSTDEIVLQVKDLQFCTPEEVGITPPAPLPGETEGECDVPVEIVFNITNGGFIKDEDFMGNPMWVLGSPASNPILMSQTFIGTVPEGVCILDFDYKVSESFRFVLYAVQTWNANTSLGGVLSPIAIVDLKEYEDFSMIADPDAEWDHVHINLYTDKMAGVHNTDEWGWKACKFAQTPNSGDLFWIQAQAPVEDSMFYLKDVTLSYDPAGVQSVAADEDSEVVASQYFDLQGRQLKAAPESGLYLRHDIRANGTSTTVKAVK